jgi:hypothetical protein
MKGVLKMKKTDLIYDENQVITVRHQENGHVVYAVQVLDGTYWAWDDKYDDCIKGSNGYMMSLLENGYIFLS